MKSLVYVTIIESLYVYALLIMLAGETHSPDLPIICLG